MRPPSERTIDPPFGPRIRFFGNSPGRHPCGPAQAQKRLLAARFASELCFASPSNSREGAGKAGYRLIPMVRVHQKKHAAVTTGSAGHRPSLRNGLRLIRDLPGNRAFLLPSPAEPLIEQLAANLASASGGQDHTTSPSAQVRLVLHHPSRPSHPASTSVTVATPLCYEAGQAAVDTDFRK